MSWLLAIVTQGGVFTVTRKEMRQAGAKVSKRGKPVNINAWLLCHFCQFFDEGEDFDERDWVWWKWDDDSRLDR